MCRTMSKHFVSSTHVISCNTICDGVPIAFVGNSFNGTSKHIVFP